MKVKLPCMRRIRPPNLTIVRRQTPLQGRVLSDPERRANDWVAAWEEDDGRHAVEAEGKGRGQEEEEGLHYQANL